MNLKNVEIKTDKNISSYIYNNNFKDSEITHY